MSMKDYLHFDEEKLRKVLKIKEEYNTGTLTLKEAQTKLKKEVKELSPYEIALAEQEIQSYKEDECRKEDIQAMLELFEGIMITTPPDFNDPEHPLRYYYEENKILREILLSIEDLIQYPLIKNQWLVLYDRLSDFHIHLARKQNQLYPALEKKGFDRPTTTMWSLDNFIRDEIKKAQELLNNDKDEEFIKMQKTIVEDIRDLIQKEETILYPTSIKLLNEEDFDEMKIGDKEIGYAWIKKTEIKTNSASKNYSNTNAFSADLIKLLTKHGITTMLNEELDVTTGKLTLEQINLIIQHLPIDITFVDENEIVRFYSDTKHRIFPRSRNIIGRDVKNCHPRSSVHIVEEIVNKFRSGEEDHIDFWINKPNLFLYIYYIAVRDANGCFRGILEMMQDCSHIRSLEGSRTLLTWGSGEQKEITEEIKDQLIVETLDTKVSLKNSLKLDAHTKLSDLLESHPWLRDKMSSINPKFRALQTPLARIMIPKSTLATMAQKSGMDVNVLIEKIRQLIREHK